MCNNETNTSHFGVKVVSFLLILYFFYGENFKPHTFFGSSRSCKKPARHIALVPSNNSTEYLFALCKSNPTPRIISCAVFLNNILNFFYLGEGTRADISHWGYITQQHNASERVLFFFPTLGSDPLIAARTQVKDLPFRLLQMSFSISY